MDAERTIAIGDVFEDQGEGAGASASAAARKAQQGGGKADGAFLTISEVAESLSVPQHVLRFWETKFTQIRPLKRGGGRRYYRPEDVALLRKIHTLLYSEGYTIRGVQKLLKGQGRQQAAAPLPSPSEQSFAQADDVGRAGESFHPSAQEVLAALLPDAAPALEASAPPPRVGGLSPLQRSLLEGLLGDLRDLRDLVAAAQALRAA